MSAPASPSNLKSSLKSNLSGETAGQKKKVTLRSPECDEPKSTSSRKKGKKSRAGVRNRAFLVSITIREPFDKQQILTSSQQRDDSNEPLFRHCNSALPDGLKCFAFTVTTIIITLLATIATMVLSFFTPRPYSIQLITHSSVCVMFACACVVLLVVSPKSMHLAISASGLLWCLVYFETLPALYVIADVYYRHIGVSSNEFGSAHGADVVVACIKLACAISWFCVGIVVHLRVASLDSVAARGVRRPRTRERR
eukprot:GHVU01196284.1.p1 GENE.GHVU01196284.1~~GHVU01196284.1.p1  ORF type:complete len:254 (+),score=1.06 GHVU01196284.1:240-1001(+)